jgi:CheY-like chemotaxis protein
MFMEILIADDHEQNLELFRLILEKSGCKVKIIAASNGAHAVALAREHYPKLILMDIEMPVMNGIEAMKTLKADAVTSGIPIVAVTGRLIEGDREYLLSQGFDGYIPKPPNIQGFIAEVKKFVPT